MLSLRSLARALPQVQGCNASNLLQESVFSASRTTLLAGSPTDMVTTAGSSRTMASRTQRSQAKRLKKKLQLKQSKAQFVPRRKSEKSYRPIDPKPPKIKIPSGGLDLSDMSEVIPEREKFFSRFAPDDGLNETYGYQTAEEIRKARQIMLNDLEDPEDNMYYSDVDMQLRMADYFTSYPGSTEDFVGTRRALAYSTRSDEEREYMERELTRIAEEEGYKSMTPIRELDTDSDLFEQNRVTGAAALTPDQARGLLIPPTQKAHGDWGEMLISTDRVAKMWRGGRIASYRTLIIGGNTNGCIGYGIGKSSEPEEAVNIASRMARRNVFFIERYRNRGLVHDLSGRQNSVIVYLRTRPGMLKGNMLCCEILKYAGIAEGSCKAVGKRNPYNVVRATFKALMTHESLETISRKRGVRLANLAKVRRLGI